MVTVTYKEIVSLANERKRTVEQIKQDVAEGKWRCVTPEQDAREIIEALANFYEVHKPSENVPDLNELIRRAQQHLGLANCHDVGSGDVNTDFGGDGSSQA